MGTALVQYDGADGDATTLAATGLGSVSLSAGDANAGLLLATRGDSAGVTAELRVYTDATNYSTTTITIPDQATIEELFVPFSAFAVGGGTGATFTSIGAIELLHQRRDRAGCDGVGAAQPAAERGHFQSGKPGTVYSNHEVHERARCEHGRFRSVPGRRGHRHIHLRRASARAARLCRAWWSRMTTVRPAVRPMISHPTFVGGDTNSDSILDIDGNVDVHGDADSDGRRIHQYWQCHCTGFQRHAGHRHGSEQPLRCECRDQRRQIHQRRRRQHGHGPRAGRGLHGDVHVCRHQPRQRRTGLGDGSSTTTARPAPRRTISTRHFRVATPTATGCWIRPKRGPTRRLAQ